MRINLHRGISNRLVLTIIVAMLGTTQFAMAAAHKPFPYRTCCGNDSRYTLRPTTTLQYQLQVKLSSTCHGREYVPTGRKSNSSSTKGCGSSSYHLGRREWHGNLVQWIWARKERQKCFIFSRGELSLADSRLPHLVH
jgi:hypothetical protein